MKETKKWYLSKNIWTGIVSVLVGLYSLVAANLGPAFGFVLPIIPEWVFVILGALGIYTRATATKSIE